MAKNENCLWNFESSGIDDVRSPLEIIEEQDAYLRSATERKLRLDIARPNPDFDPDQYTVRISAPTLNYSYNLFGMQYDMGKMYPLVVRFESNEYRIETEIEFVNMLKTIIQSEGARRVVHSLMRQANKVDLF